MSINKPTAQSVIDLTGTSFSSSVVQMVIDDAALVAVDCLQSADADTQEAALRWLTAHLIASTGREAVVASERLGDAQKSYYRSALGDGISGTTYGQQAIALLPCLARTGRAKARITVI